MRACRHTHRPHAHSCQEMARYFFFASATRAAIIVSAPWLATTLLVLLTVSCSPIEHAASSGGAPNAREISATSGVAAPLLGDEIDLETMEGVDELTRLVLLKTDSLPADSDRLDARYLNGLMETLYTGLRKPFKSVSADILGIFPTLDFLNITCEAAAPGGPQPPVKRRRRQDDSSAGPPPSFNNESVLIGGGDPATADSAPSAPSYKSSIQVCKAVTNDCLSMEDLVQILPPSITNANTLLVRLCPVILFRLLSNICHTGSGSGDRESSEQQQQRQPTTTTGGGGSKLNLSTLAMLRNLQSSSEAHEQLRASSLSSKHRPQRLHKKLKTQTLAVGVGAGGPASGGRRLTVGALKQHGGGGVVDEQQLLKIRLKLSEPSIEKVWLFSLLFVVLSIVVSMGGLIVLPFVKKTTRRRILTLFEGLAVGGLTGSATLHMFPQAFGLVDENYHRYFWRIFVVFLGIYLCYLCERTIKILKVVRAKMRRRSRASLQDMDFRYGWAFSSPAGAQPGSSLLGAAFAAATQQPHDNHTADDGNNQPSSSALQAPNKWVRQKISVASSASAATSMLEPTHALFGVASRVRRKRHESESGGGSKRQKKKKKSSRREAAAAAAAEEPEQEECLELATLAEQPGESLAPTRERLVRCLKSVRSQFSPVYAVFSQPTGADPTNAPASARDPKLGRAQKRARTSEELRWARSNHHHQQLQQQQQQQHYSPRRDRLSEAGGGRERQGVDRGEEACRWTQTVKRRQARHKEIETMLYHRNLIEQQQQQQRRDAREGTNSPATFTGQRRFSDADLVGAHERQDQDNPARMSVDTVSWMILFGDGLLNVIDGLSIGAAFERNILAGISISVAVMLEEVTHRLGTTAILIRTGMSIKQSFLCTFLSACALFPGMIVGIMLSDATDEATPYIFCAAGGIFLYTGLVDVMKEMNRSIENAMRKDIKTTLKIFALQNVGICLAVVFLSFLALYEPDFEEYQKILNNNN